MKNFAGASLLLSAVLTAAAAETPPNVLFIAIDDMNEDIGCLGGPALTPNIDHLASRGMLFTDAHCNVPVCNASRASLMTGQLPPKTGTYENNTNFRDAPGGKERATLPQYFRQHGYEAVAAGKVFHHGRNEKLTADPWSDPVSWDRQYKNKIGMPHPQIAPEDMWHKGTLKGYRGNSIYFGEAPVSCDEETFDWQNAKWCADYLQQEHDKPFFLACGIFKPHAPFIAPPKYFDLYPLDEIEIPEAYKYSDLDDLGPEGIRWAHKSDLHKSIVKFGVWKNFIQGYRAATSFADNCVGVVLDALENSPYRDNTVVILFSDHGFHLGSKEHWAKFTFWNRGTRTPFIIYMPNMKPGSCDNTISLIDIYPTLVELCGLPPKDDVDGQSLAPLLTDPSKDWKNNVHLFYFEPGNEAIITKEWRYIRYTTGEEELYNRLKDPNDWNNLVHNSEMTPILEQFRKQRTFKEKQL